MEIKKKLIKSKFSKIILLLLLTSFLIFSYYFCYLYLNEFKIKQLYKKRIKYLKNYNVLYNESNLSTFQDKINWLIIHDSNELKSNCSDKILLHEYSKKKLGKDICNKLLKIYKHIEDINLNELPNKFVLKANHGSGFNIIVNNKSNFDYISAKVNLKKWLNIDYGKISTEFHYSSIFFL